MAFDVKQGSTRPYLRMTLEENGVAVNLTGITSVVFRMRITGATAYKVNAAAVVVDALNGVVEYRWMAANTDTAGTYNGEFVVTFADASVGIWPSNGYITVEVWAPA